MKIIFLDADGTLFHPMGYIPKSTLDAIKLAQENGHKICLCTGRQKAEVYGDLASIDYDGMVVGAGAYVEAKGKELCNLAFSDEQKKNLLDYIYENEIPCLFESSFKVYANQIAADTILRLIDIQCKDLTEEQRKGHGLTLVYNAAHVEDEKTIRNAPINKISFLESHISYNEIDKTFSDEFALVPATFAPFGKESGEIARKDVTKGTGMEYLIQYYNIDPKDVIAIGDGYNDIKMFEKASLSIAMGNAPKDIQEFCDMVTTSIDEDGIYMAFKQLNII